MMLGLDQLATVFTETVATGLYQTVEKSNLKCRLAHVNMRPAPGGNERAELAAIRDMMFDPDYVMPENCQLDVDGVRWQPVAGSFGAFRGPSGRVTYRRCDLMRQS